MEFKPIDFMQKAKKVKKTILLSLMSTFNNIYFRVDQGELDQCKF